jgi:hypothetical protein
MALEVRQFTANEFAFAKIATSLAGAGKFNFKWPGPEHTFSSNHNQLKHFL